MRRTLWQTLKCADNVLKSSLPPIRGSRPCFRRNYNTVTVNAADLSFGQPVHETHPHLLRPGELTPGITAQEYADRRSQLAAKLPDKAIAIVAASDIQFRSGSVFYEFHQDPDFLYLTGFNEPEALAVIGKDVTGKDHTFHLFVREKDPEGRDLGRRKIRYGSCKRCLQCR